MLYLEAWRRNEAKSLRVITFSKRLAMAFNEGGIPFDGPLNRMTFSHVLRWFHATNIVSRHVRPKKTFYDVQLKVLHCVDRSLWAFPTKGNRHPTPGSDIRFESSSTNHPHANREPFNILQPRKDVERVRRVKTSSVAHLHVVPNSRCPSRGPAIGCLAQPLLRL